MKILESISAHGHENIRCSHKSTIELTKENNLTKKGDCILGINSSKACIDLNSKLKELILKGKKINVIIKVDEITDFFYGYGDSKLSLLDDKDIVFRKSDFICNRTILIKCNKASNELNQNLIEKLKIPGKTLSIIFRE